MEKSKIQSFKFIKAICALGIIIFHFSCHISTNTFKPLYTYSNGDWGGVFVTIFFIISGSLLYYNYNQKINIPTYYKKRWLSIFPMYYIAYLIFEIKNMFINKSIFFRGNPLYYFFTIIGMDGYLISNTTTYYILGEWFLGMIIILYLIFPIILKLFKKNDKLFLITTIFLYLIFLDNPIINPNSFWSITSCLLSFVFGMFFIKHRKKFQKKPFILISLIICLILITLKTTLTFDIGNHLLGIYLFVLLTIIGEKIMKYKIINKIFTELNNLSYSIFLIHHITIVSILNLFEQQTEIENLILLISILLITIIEAKILTKLTKYIISKVSNIKKLLIKIKESYL